MTLDTLMMLVGALIAVMQFLGFPSSWDNVLYFLAGALVILLGIIVRRRTAQKPPAARSNGTFSENAPDFDRHDVA